MAALLDEAPDARATLAGDPSPLFRPLLKLALSTRSNDKCDEDKDGERDAVDTGPGIASAGNSGVATTSAAGSLVSIGNVNCGGIAGNAIGVGDTVGSVGVDAGNVANSTQVNVSADDGAALGDASGSDNNLTNVTRRRAGGHLGSSRPQARSHVGWPRLGLFSDCGCPRRGDVATHRMQGAPWSKLADAFIYGLPGLGVPQGGTTRHADALFSKTGRIQDLAL